MVFNDVLRPLTLFGLFVALSTISDHAIGYLARANFAMHIYAWKYRLSKVREEESKPRASLETITQTSRIQHLNQSYKREPLFSISYVYPVYPGFFALQGAFFSFALFFSCWKFLEARKTVQDHLDKLPLVLSC